MTVRYPGIIEESRLAMEAVVANDRGIKSTRYHFSNKSEDIKALFCASLDRLGIPWTRPSARDIAIYRKAAVARLDEFIGPKR